MTRDVKVGLLVSCSFLCLVGVVVTTKLREKGMANAKAARHSPGPMSTVRSYCQGQQPKAPRNCLPVRGIRATLTTRGMPRKTSLQVPAQPSRR